MRKIALVISTSTKGMSEKSSVMLHCDSVSVVNLKKLRRGGKNKIATRITEEASIAQKRERLWVEARKMDSVLDLWFNE